MMRANFIYYKKGIVCAISSSKTSSQSRKLGVGMIRHGTEFQFMKGVGAKEFEKVIMFGPGRRKQESVSSMPRGEHSH